VIYLAGIVLVGVLGYQLNFGQTGKILNSHLFERILKSELQRTPDNPKLYSLMGDMYYSRKQFPETIQAYEQAISLDPKNAQTLNNLAWLYATCEDESYKDPTRALVLAEKAAKLEKSPHILDTLAESYFINGRYEEAIEAGRKALMLAKDNHAYYEGQLEKFKN
jgi:cytochrome c-type biogenesis protein CcmH/NrfG